jgi:hypothetical protein
MFALNRTTRVFLKIEATNLRLGFDGLYGEVVSILTQDPPLGPRLRVLRPSAHQGEVADLRWIGTVGMREAA